MRRWIVPLIVVASAVSSNAQAEEPAAPAAADTPQQLFDRGAGLTKQGRFEPACPLFAESYRLDPQTGTLIHLADCEEHMGELVRALAYWHEAMGKLDPDSPFRKLAKDHAAALAPRVARLTIQLTPGMQAAAHVFRAGIEVASATLPVPMEVNPGTLEVVVKAPGRQEHRESVTLAEGQRKEMAIEPGPALAVPVPPGPARAIPSAIAEGEPSWLRRHRTSAMTMGVAAVLAGAGGALGGRTWAHYDDLAKTCQGSCPEGDLDSLHREATATNVLFAAAGAAALISVGVFVFGEQGKPRSVAVATDGAVARFVVQY